MKFKITIFKNGEKRSEKEFRIPRFMLDSFWMKASKMFARKPDMSFTIEEI